MAFRRWFPVGGAFLAIAVIVLLLWEVPRWQGDKWQGHVPTAALPLLVNEFRRTMAQIIGGAALLAGLYFTWRRAEISLEEQITGRLSRAIEHLGNDKVDIRLGGIYALERIARDSAYDYGPVMEILSVFVRERLSRQKRGHFDHPAPATPLRVVSPDIDVHAALAVIARRKRLKGERRLDLPYLDFTRVSLHEGNFDRAILWETRLAEARFENCSFVEADLRESDGGGSFTNCDFRRATLYKLRGDFGFSKCNLRGAMLQTYSRVRFYECDLRDVRFQNAHLTGSVFAESDLAGANFENATLSGVNFRSATGLSACKFEKTTWDETTEWPSDFKPPPSAK